MEQEATSYTGNVAVSSENPIVNDLLSKCHSLLDEIQQFRDYLIEHKKEKEVEVRHFQSAVQAEQKSIEKVLRPFHRLDWLLLNHEVHR